MSGLATPAVLVLGGAGAGVLGTAGGITSLISYPVLLAVGVPPLPANLTNSIALLGSGASSTLRSGPDLRGHTPTLRRWIPGTVIASGVGAALLVTTPPGAFDRIVPFLVAIGSLVLLAQPRIAAWQVKRERRLPGPVVAGLGAGMGVYNGYFGAGSGIITIALLMLTTEPLLSRANAVKNALLLCADLLPAVLFAVLGPVVWSAVWPLALGAVLGGLIGPSIARRAPQQVLRVLIGLCGLGLAVSLLV